MRSVQSQESPREILLLGTLTCPKKDTTKKYPWRSSLHAIDLLQCVAYAWTISKLHMRRQCAIESMQTAIDVLLRAVAELCDQVALYHDGLHRAHSFKAEVCWCCKCGSSGARIATRQSVH
eukprot:2619764-Amphidinium_carterae.2